jgi:hypothetical protein
MATGISQLNPYKGKSKKGKVVPVLFSTEHYAVEAYWVSGSIAPRILETRH